MMRLEIHILQNFAPSNLNRDDTGSPKDAEFGGHRRARISSQCLKLAVRKHFEQEKLLPDGQLAERTKRLAAAAATLLTANGREAAAADRAARAAVTAFLPKSEDKEEHKSPYLLFLGKTEIERFATEVEKHWDVFSVERSAPADAPPTDASAGRGRGRARARAATPEPTVPDGFVRAVGQMLDGGKAADLALFGRMLADLPENNVNAACQVAHSISTNKTHAIEMDYYTAVDDLKPNDTAGADMIGTVEFNSACYYRYANLDIEQLRTNLQGDADLVHKTTEAFLKAFVHAIPTGKQNTFAAQQKPSLVFAVVRSGGPMSLTNAFVRPVTPGTNGDLVEGSIDALDKHYGQLTKMFGDGGLKASAVCMLDDRELKNLKDRVDNIDAIISRIVPHAVGNGGAR